MREQHQYRIIEGNDDDLQLMPSVHLSFITDTTQLYLQKQLEQTNSDLNKLEELALRNIHQRPLSAYGWLDLAKVKHKQGDIKSAIEYATKAQELWPTSSYSLYIIASFWVFVGEIDKAIRTLGQYLYTQPKELPGILALTKLLESDDQRLVDLLFSVNSNGDNSVLIAKRILTGAIRQKEFDLTGAIWNKFEPLFIEDAKLVLRYVSYLIKQNQASKAVDIWSAYSGHREIDEIFLNPGFESELELGGFDWKIPASKETEWIIDQDIAYSGDRSFKLTFLGESNVDYWHLYQIIPVEPGAHYKVTAYWRGTGISTRSTPYIQLHVLNAEKRVYSRSESKRGNWSWEPVVVDIKIPDDSSLLRVMIRRNKTTALDKNITGTLWLDEFKIRKID